MTTPILKYRLSIIQRYCLSTVLPFFCCLALSVCSFRHRIYYLLAGVAGLEPAVEGKPLVGVKVRCLTNLAIPQYKGGTPERSRTPNRSIRNPMLCPVELLAQMETPIGFEPMILGLQPRALPLGYGVIN